MILSFSTGCSLELQQLFSLQAEDDVGPSRRANPRELWRNGTEATGLGNPEAHLTTGLPIIGATMFPCYAS